MTDNNSRSSGFKSYIFLLREGEAIERDCFDYSLMLLQMKNAELIASPHKSRSSRPVYFKHCQTHLTQQYDVEQEDENEAYDTNWTIGHISES